MRLSLRRNATLISRIKSFVAEIKEAVGKIRQKNSGWKTMNTNQSSDAPTAATATMPFASAILNNVFGKNPVMNSSNDNSSDNGSDEKLTESFSPSGENGGNAKTVNQILSRLESKKEQAAVNLGIGTNEVETIPFDLSMLETEGIFLNVDASGFGVLERQLEWKTLGVKLPEQAAVRVSPPRCGLLPDVYRRKLLRAAHQAHNALTRYGFRFTLCETVWGTSDYKWIPWNAFELFEQEYKKACETLAAAKAEILANYDEIVLTMRRSFADLAEDSAKRFEATSGDEPFDRDEFKSAVVARAMGMIPTTDMIRDGLTIAMKPKVIVLGSEMLAEQNRSRELQLDAAKIEAERESVRIELDSKARFEQLKITDFEAEQRRESEVKERIRQMKIEAAKDAAAEAVSPIKEGLEQITAKLYEAACEMAEKLTEADFVPGALAKRARQMCEWYQLMNFTGDTSLETVLENLQAAAGREAKLRSPAEMRQVLGDVMRATTVQSKRLLDEDRLSALEI